MFQLQKSIIRIKLMQVSPQVLKIIILFKLPFATQIQKVFPLPDAKDIWNLILTQAQGKQESHLGMKQKLQIAALTCASLRVLLLIKMILYPC